MTIEQKLNPEGKKKLLALDGGGIRGLITIEILAEIERILRRELKKDHSFVLADYFDYIAGTSTGAILATCLSLGMSVDTIRDFYVNSGKEMFDKASILKRYHYKFEDENLSKMLQNKFQAKTLGHADVRTLLMLVLRNATTDSPWPLSNNPNAKYNVKNRDDCNLNLPLWQLVRASTAAPVFFPPECITLGKKDFIFVDGGITPYNNPAFQLFLMATIEPYKLNWRTGEDKMLLVSIGTGTNPDANSNLHPSDMNLIYNAQSIPSALMFASSTQQDFLCRTFGNCLEGGEIDREIGDLRNIKGAVSNKLFTYMRYNIELTSDGLKNIDLDSIKPEDVQSLDSVEHMDDLQKIGGKVAELKVKNTHFKNFL